MPIFSILMFIFFASATCSKNSSIYVISRITGISMFFCTGVKIIYVIYSTIVLCLFCNLKTKWKHCVHPLTISPTTQFTASLYIIVLVIAK